MKIETTIPIGDPTVRAAERLLTPKHIAKLTGMTPEYTKKMCGDGYLPAVQLGESRWYVPKKSFIDLVMGRVNLESDAEE